MKEAPMLSATRRAIDTSPAAFGVLESSIDLLGDPAALQAKMSADGYLFLPGLLDRANVLAARRVCVERLAAAGYIDSRQPLMDAIANPQADCTFMPELADDNPALMDVVYGPRMLGFFSQLLAGEVRHFDFTWVRAVAPGSGTDPHMDIVYMGRGTPKVYTAWTPIGDIPLSTGGLLILERSHTHERLNENYGKKDVDSFCSNRRGDDYTAMGGGGNIASNGRLSKDAVKLRKNLGGRWLTADFRAGDVLVFSMFTVHTSLDNGSNTIRLSTDTRYQLASEPIDERWIGDQPIGHGPAAKRGLIC
ncbi:MAG: phytanoyl-CoA dioxygenase family protein [Roseiflexaceae bacterium]|nr:phytanoyl-CoA dioxygenase family protein [Roseiflexaceae bacterium]